MAETKDVDIVLHKVVNIVLHKEVIIVHHGARAATASWPRHAAAAEIRPQGEEHQRMAWRPTSSTVTRRTWERG